MKTSYFSTSEAKITRLQKSKFFKFLKKKKSQFNPEKVWVLLSAGRVQGTMTFILADLDDAQYEEEWGIEGGFTLPEGTFTYSMTSDQYKRLGFYSVE